ncbi:MAG: outer membrane beta-barrel protein [Bacteroidales bacterium]|nr:outer membrane beta-barrel protein [Bacteroidales bacterium]
MKNYFIAFVSILIMLSNSSIGYSQSTDEKDSQLRVGIGIDLEFSGFEYYPIIPPPNVMVSVELFNSLRIEPGIGFNSNNSDSENGSRISNSKSINYSIGTYWLINSNKITPYLGLFIDYKRTISDYTNIDYPDTRENESGQSRIGPTVGLEYKIVDKFRLGCEYNLLRLKGKSEYKNGPDIQETAIEGWGTAVRLKFRYYF